MPVIVLAGVFVFCCRRFWPTMIKPVLFCVLLGEHALMWAILGDGVGLDINIILHLLLTLSSAVLLVVWREMSPTRQKRREALAAREAVESALSAERARIARELHDTVGHGLTMISLSARQGGAERNEEGLRSIDHTAHHAMQEVSRVLRQLSVAGEGHHSGVGSRRRQLGQVVEGVVSSIERLGLPIQLALYDAEIELLDPLCRVIERGVRESLLNIIKHMPAATAAVTVMVGNEIELIVRGDRRSAPISLIAADRPPLTSSGRGLKSIEDELNIYGGSLSLTIAADFSLVEMRIPLVLYGRDRTRCTAGARALTGLDRLGG